VLLLAAILLRVPYAFARFICHNPCCPQEEEEERRLAEEEAKLGVGRVQVVPVKGGTVDVELGYMPGVKPPAPGEEQCGTTLGMPRRAAFACRHWRWLSPRITRCGPVLPCAGEPLSEEQLEFLRERERRTAVHQKQRW
jgi:hypothetical protein